MNYTIEKVPHERLPVTSFVLDHLGFHEYHDEHGTWGYRWLIIGDNKFEITEIGETVDDSDGYADWGTFKSDHWSYNKGKKNTHYELFFLHEMYQCIQSEFPVEFLAEFESICRKNKMGVYIDSYLQTLKD